MSMNRKGFSAMVCMVLMQFRLLVHHKTIWKWEHETSPNQDFHLKWRKGLQHATYLCFINVKKKDCLGDAGCLQECHGFFTPPDHAAIAARCMIKIATLVFLLQYAVQGTIETFYCALAL